MNRDELMTRARALGVDFPRTATKAELTRLIQEAEGSNGSAPVVEQHAVNGFVVEKRTGADGNLTIAIVPIGDATVLEAVTVLSMALRAAKQQAGIE